MTKQADPNFNSAANDLLAIVPLLSYEGRVISAKSEEFTVLQYRGLELTNGLRVLLVSDPTTDKSAAAMDVNVGSPNGSMGVARAGTLLRAHAGFLVLINIRKENEFLSHPLSTMVDAAKQSVAWGLRLDIIFISENGGTYNATTDADHTNYHFDIKPDELKFISENGGTYNATTDADHTNYHFDIKPDELKVSESLHSLDISAETGPIERFCQRNTAKINFELFAFHRT
ncbi:hypothetical protein COOONC_03506 [Cooperia oncophora]